MINNTKENYNPSSEFEICFIISYVSFFIMGPWRNSARLWLDAGYKVNVIQFNDDNLFKHSSSLDKEINIIHIYKPLLYTGLLWIVKKGFGLFKKIGLKKTSTIGAGIAYVINSIYFSLMVKKKINNSSKYVLIPGDPIALNAANKIRHNNILIYWSLELKIENELKNFGEKLLKQKERKINQTALCTIDFGKQRANILRKENRLSPEHKIFSIPNSPLGRSEYKRSDYFRKKFGIPSNKKIILHSGGFAPGYSISELINNANSWNEKYVLVIHTNRKPKWYENIELKEVHKYPGKVYYDDEPLPFEEIENVYSSANIGLMLHGSENQKNTNLFYTDLSSGRIFNHLKFGVPVITRELAGYKKFIEGNKFGKCITHIGEMNKAIDEIINNEEKYILSCLKNYNSFIFEDSHADIKAFIEQAIFDSNLQK